MIEATEYRHEEQPVQVATGSVILEGCLGVPVGAQGVVLFAHGSGSSYLSPRNRYVAHVLREACLATLLIDLLTPEEEAVDLETSHLGFDVGMLAERILVTSDWLAQQDQTRHLRIGYFGASTGAGAALIAAGDRPSTVGAVVSHAGRPDLAKLALTRVRAPTLFIVGGSDTLVVQLNQMSQSQIPAETHMEIIPGATHLFEEPGALEAVARLAQQWFFKHLVPH